MAGLSGAGGGGGGSAIRAGRAFVSLFLENNQFLRGLKQVQSQAHAFGKVMAKAGAVTTAAGLAAVAPLKLVIDSIGDLAKQGEVAAGLGLTAEAFTGIAGVAKSVGEDTREFTESLVTLGKLGTDAAAGTEQAAAAFKALGLNANEFIKLGADEQFFTIFEALSRVQDPLTKVRLLMQAFGEDGGKYLLPLLEKSPDEIRRMSKGFAVASDDMKAAKDSQAALAAATAGLGRIWTQVVVALAPAIAQVANVASKFIGPLAEIVSNNRELVVIFAAVAAGMLVAGLAIAGLGGAFMLAGAAISGGLAVLAAVKVVLLAILSPVGLTILAVAALAAGLAYLFSLTSAGAGFFPELLNGFLSLGDTIKSVMGGISDAFAVGDMALAGEIAMAGLKSAFADAMAWMTGRWNKFKGFFVDGWHDAVKLMSLAISGGIKFLEVLFIDLGQFIRRNLGDSITETLRKVLVGFIAFWKLTNVLGANDANIAMAEQLYKTLSNTPEQAEEAKNKAEKDRLDRNKIIEDMAKKEQELRDAARAADKAGADEEAKRLRKQLEDLTARAKALKAQKQWDEFDDWLFGPDMKKGAAAAAKIAVETKGGFGGANARQMFAFGDSGKKVAEKTLSATEQVAQNTGVMAKKLDELDGVAFA